MHEIKFRAIIPKRNCRWCFGLPDLLNPYFTMREIIIPWLQAGNVPDRFTGFKDKNGKEIYEGDIIKIGDGKIGVVKWDEVHTGFSVRTQDDDSYSVNFHHYGEMKQMVIGNIYENPELFKEKS